MRLRSPPTLEALVCSLGGNIGVFLLAAGRVPVRTSELYQRLEGKQGIFVLARLRQRLEQLVLGKRANALRALGVSGRQA